MKKTYLITAITFCALILIVFLAGAAQYSKLSIDEANNLFINSAECDPSMLPAKFDDDEAMAAETYVSWGKNFYWEEPDKYGFYGAILDPDNDYRPVIEPRNFLEISQKPVIVSREVIETENSYEETIKYAEDTKGCRIMFIDDPLMFMDYYYDASISDGYCDDHFVTAGNLTLESYFYSDPFTVSVPAPEYVNPDKTVPFEQWIPQKDGIEVIAYIWNSSAIHPKLNNMARTTCDNYLKKYLEGEIEAGTEYFEEGFFTTKYIAVLEIDVPGHHYIMPVCLVYKPFRYVLEENMLVYVLFLLTLIIAESLTAITFILLYRNQKSFELRNRRLTRGLAHELKTPLAITKTCVENWDYIDEDQRPEYSAKIISEVDHMSDLITRLLDLSKFSSGDINMNPEHIDLMILTKTVYKRMTDLVKEKDLDVEISADSEQEEFPVFADPDMMNIAIDNFISNAVKFADKKISVKLSQNGRKIKFEIINDGAKISKLDQKRVWDVFYKTDESQSDRIGSSGVGLSVVKNILDVHKAKYGCTSNDSGTCFWFTMDSDKQKE